MKPKGCLNDLDAPSLALARAEPQGFRAEKGLQYDGNERQWQNAGSRRPRAKVTWEIPAQQKRTWEALDEK